MRRAPSTLLMLPRAMFVALRASAIGCLLLAHAFIALHHLHVFRLMFYSPRIAPNTGNAIRMVAATGCELHLVEPLGFDLSEPKLRRAGLDYHDLASVTVHESLATAWRASFADAGLRVHRARDSRRLPTSRIGPAMCCCSGRSRPVWTRRRSPIRAVTDKVRIPMIAGRRSLNLSNAAAVAVYEAWRQHGFAGGRGAHSSGHQLSKCTTCSTGSRLAGRKSVPLVYAIGNRPPCRYCS